MNSRQILQIAAVAALLAKLLCAALTVGTNDVETFYNFGRFIHEHGLLAQYRATSEFNHTPLVGWFVAGIYGLAKGIGFNWLLRVPGIVADFLAVGMLWNWGRETREFASGVSHHGRDGARPSSAPGSSTATSLPAWALLLFALSPVHFMVSGYHGNVDSVLALLLLLAVREGARGRSVWCGVFFGMACQIKVIPLLVAPALFFFWWERRAARAFFLTATPIILAGWAYPLIALPATFIHNVLGYNSNWGSWGLTWALHATGLPQFAPVGFRDLTSAQLAIMSAMKVVIIAGALVLAWTRRRLATAELPGTLALVWGLFFVCAPGVGAQYLVWIAPFLLFFSARWFAAFTAASSAFLFAFYNTISGGLPWWHGVSTAELLPHWVAWSSLPWITLAGFVVWGAAQSSPSSSSSSSASSSSGGRS